MIKESIYRFTSAYRGDFDISAYKFNKGEKSCCIVGALRGNEIQQLYVCSKLIRELKELEKQCKISYNHEITVIPCVNPFSVNIGRKYWCNDDRDINRDFPGNSEGEPTQRIAAALLEAVREYRYGIQFPSFYIQGDFIPHVRMMETGKENVSLASLFGLPYVALRKPQPYEECTLNYNWQMSGTSAFSVYARETENIDEEGANTAVAAVLRFLSRMGIIKYQCHGGYMSTAFDEDSLMSVKSPAGGFFRSFKKPGDGVVQGETMAEILHPYENTVLGEVKSPCSGTVFFSHISPLAAEDSLLFKVIKRIRS